MVSELFPEFPLQLGFLGKNLPSPSARGTPMGDFGDSSRRIVERLLVKSWARALG